MNKKIDKEKKYLLFGFKRILKECSTILLKATRKAKIEQLALIENELSRRENV